jgi:hypothetical protein
LFGDLVVGDDDDGVFEILKLCFAEEVYKEAERESVFHKMIGCRQGESSS